MRTTCIINNYNYHAFVGEAVESALAQSRPFDQIVVVDDGSTDGSRELLERDFGRRANVEIVCKENGGQLSSFNHAIHFVRGDLVFFLDADDRYRRDYVATALAAYKRTRADFLIAGMENFGPNVRRPQAPTRERDLGFSVLTTLFAGTWVGAPTSCLSMRTSLARRILPFPFEAEWRIRADNVLVYGASILGAHKYQLGEVCVDRRIHGKNLFFGQDVNRHTTMRNALELNRLFAWYAEQAGYNLADLPRLLPREFRTVERPTLKEFRRYLRLAWTTRQTLFTRAKQTLSLTAHMLASMRTSRATSSRAMIAGNEQQRRAA